MVFLKHFRTFIPLLVLMSGISMNAWSQETGKKKWVCTPSEDVTIWSCSHSIITPEIYTEPPAFRKPSSEQPVSIGTETRASTPITKSDIKPAHVSTTSEKVSKTRVRKVNGCPSKNLVEFIPPPGDETLINADHTAGTTEQFELTGNVELANSNHYLSADKIFYDRPKDRADASGNVFFRQKGLQISGETGSTQIEGDKAEFTEADYEILSRNARGRAKTIQVESSTRIKLGEVSYTTCAPDRKDWQLKADKVDLDRSSGEGKARNVTIKFKGVPIFYTPYISFPIDERRKSGFLVPDFGNSDESGGDFSIPYYWNISPNRDATITPRILEKRGLQLTGEYRYLHKNSIGKAGASILPDDDRFNDDRYLATYQHYSNFWNHWSAAVELNHASDREYFEDLGDNLSLASTTNLERRVDLQYNRTDWSLLTRIQDYQPMGTTLESYQRIPQVLLTGNIPLKNYPVNLHMAGEFVRFDHKDNVTTGNRLDLYPAISYELHNPAWYVTPKLGVRYTGYSLENPGAGNPDSPNRTTPMFSLDSGLFLERDTGWGLNGKIQTLEPRLYYLYVQNEGQDNFPVFDTSALDFSFGQLFRENRFSGADRQGDANQLTLALTSRILNKNNGREQFRASIGQIAYFDDRKVTIPGQSVATTNSSSLVASMTAHLNRLSYISADVQWDPDSEKTEKSAFRFHYQSDEEHILNLTYRYRPSSGVTEGIEQTDLSLLWPISGKWTAIARWNYSLPEDRSLESFAGLQYETCCWSVRLVGRRYANGGTDEYNEGIYLTLALKGLTSIGSSIDSLLENGILGYNDIDRY